MFSCCFDSSQSLRPKAVRAPPLPASRPLAGLTSLARFLCATWPCGQRLKLRVSATQIHFFPPCISWSVHNVPVVKTTAFLLLPGLRLTSGGS